MKEPMKRRERRPIRSTAKRPLQKGELSATRAGDDRWRSRDLRESSSDVTGSICERKAKSQNRGRNPRSSENATHERMSWVRYESEIPEVAKNLVP